MSLMQSVIISLDTLFATLLYRKKNILWHGDVIIVKCARMHYMICFLKFIFLTVW
jgi:hypothetical protein